MPSAPGTEKQLMARVQQHVRFVDLCESPGDNGMDTHTHTQTHTW